MKMLKNASRYIQVIIIALLALCSTFLIYNSFRLSDKLDHERLEKESLLSEKIHLSRSLDEIMKELSSVRERNHELNQILETTKKHLVEK